MDRTEVPSAREICNCQCHVDRGLKEPCFYCANAHNFEPFKVAPSDAFIEWFDVHKCELENWPDTARAYAAEVTASLRQQLAEAERDRDHFRDSYGRKLEVEADLLKRLQAAGESHAILQQNYDAAQEQITRKNEQLAAQVQEMARLRNDRTKWITEAEGHSAEAIKQTLRADSSEAREAKLREALQESLPHLEYKRTHTQTAAGRKNVARAIKKVHAALEGKG